MSRVSGKRVLTWIVLVCRMSERINLDIYARACHTQLI